MDIPKGNIMNQKPKCKNIRDKNFSLGESEITAKDKYISYKEQKLNQIAEHRRKALLGSRADQKQLQQEYK